MSKQNRWVLLQHKNAPDDEKKNHFDLLLEDGNSCRAWRLDAIPTLDGKSVSAIKGPFHRLEWLDKIEAAVSGGRGWARRVEAGVFEGPLPVFLDDPIRITINSQNLSGYLEITNGFCRIFSKKFDTST